MSELIIDKKACTRCNICAIVCTMKIIEKANDHDFPKIPEEKADYCLKCGHCESYCAQKALILDFRPDEKIDAPGPDTQIDPHNLSLYLKKRRSVRHYVQKTLDKALIARMIDVASYAASGGNSQPVKWIVITDASDVKHIAKLTIDWMRSIQNSSHPLANYVPVLISSWDNGLDIICNQAPHLLFAHVPIKPIDNPTEAIIALTHFDIVAPSYGVGTCWAGFVKMALDSYKPLQDFVSVPEGRKAACPMMFGYPKYQVSSIPRRNPVDISWK